MSPSPSPPSSPSSSPSPPSSLGPAAVGAASAASAASAAGGVDGTDAPADGGASLEARVAEVGRGLAETLGAVIRALPGGPSGPQALASDLGLDKVLASRVLKCVRAGDPMATVHAAPGPAPMRRLVRAAGRRGVHTPLVDAALDAVNAFDHLIRRDIGDRSALDAIIAAWLPEARREFELRRKQSLFRATSQLKGAAADVTLATVILHPAEDGEKLDVVWIMGLLGLQRLRPGVAVRCTSRRLAPAEAPRQPRALDGAIGDTFDAFRLDSFCDAPPAPVERRTVGESIHYLLAGDAFGPGSATDLLVGEVNFAEMPRFVPAGSGRRGYVFAEISTPAKQLLFDCFVHDDVYPRRDPQLLIHDTSFEGVADLNDPTRDADRLDLLESIQLLGPGVGAARHADAPHHVRLLRHAFASLGWDERSFRGYRCSIDYPVYGSQVSMAFEPPSG